jgi:SAM-dependent methyltransferase
MTELLSNLRPYVDVNWVFPIYECNNCGVRFALRDPHENYHEILHSTLGGGYDSHYRVARRVKEYLINNDLHECEQYIKSKDYKYNEVIKFVKTKEKGASILEIGCSSGFITAFFRSLGYDIDGIDISETAINYARNHFGPFYSHHPKKEKYDAIVHLGLIGCVDDPKAFLSGYIDLLKPEGEMFFNAPDVESPKQIGEIWVSTPPPDLIYLFNDKAFKYMVSNSFVVTCKKVRTKGGEIRKNLKIITNRDFQTYPRKLLKKHNNSIEKKTPFQRKLARLVKIILYKTYPLLIPFLRQYDNEYGIFVTIKRR